MKSSLYGAGAEYALHSLLVLAAREAPVSVRDLARFQDLPERFLAKIFARLQKAGLVEGIEGIRGGFVLARPPGSVTVREILEAVDPDRTLFACAEIRRHCALFGDQPPGWSVTGTCRIHLFMREAESALQAFLGSKTLADLGASSTGRPRRGSCGRPRPGSRSAGEARRDGRRRSHRSQ